MNNIITRHLTEFLFYDGVEKEAYEAVRSEIYERSRKKLANFSVALIFAFSMLYLCSFFIRAIASFQPLYLTMVVSACAAVYLFRTSARSNPFVGTLMKYLLEIIILAFGIIIGIDTSPEQPAVSFVVLISMIPLLIYDNVIRSLLIRATVILVYLAVAAHYKTEAALETDLINLISFTVLSTLCIAASNNTQIKEIYLEKRMQSEIDAQTAAIQKNLDRIKALSLQTISAFVKSIDAKDRYTNGHSLRVAEYARLIARKLGKSEAEQMDIYYIGLMHDVGKIGIPDAIINKPSKLTDNEYETIKQHTVIGYNILREIDELPDSAMGAYLHHEWFDGSGYPLGLSGAEIPEVARIISVADSYDAMTSNRSYRKLLPQQTVAEELRRGRGTQFDPVFADIMLKIMQEDEHYLLHE